MSFLIGTESSIESNELEREEKIRQCRAGCVNIKMSGSSPDKKKNGPDQKGYRMVILNKFIIISS